MGFLRNMNMKSNKKVKKSLRSRGISKENIKKSLSNEAEISKKIINNSEDREFENYLQKIEDPDYDGQDVS